MSAGNVKHQAAAAATAEHVEQLRADIHTQLAVLRELLVYLEDLASTHQSVGLGFLTDVAKKARDEQARADREAARGGVVGPIGARLRWARSSTVLGTGQVPAPVTVTAVSAAAELRAALQHQVRRLARPAAIAAAASVPGGHGRLPGGLPTTDGTTEQLLDHLDVLVDVYTRRTGLEGLLRDLEHLERVAREVVDGPGRTNHPDACPWCGRHTLVVHHRAPGRDGMFIRCDGQHPCTCTDEWCPCHRNPVKHRHEWINSGRAANPVDGRSPHSLSSLITQRKELAVMETRALDALERIRALHQPTWTDPEGNTHTWYVVIDEPPADHICVIDGLDRCDPEADEHVVPACIECRRVTSDGDEGSVLWPCPTYQACDLDNPAGIAGDSPNPEE